MFDKMKNEKMVPDIETLNLIIRNLMYQKVYNSPTEAIEKTIDMLKYISENGIVPNIRTFNNTLYSLSQMGRNIEIPSVSLSILKEMKLLNIG